MTLHNGKVYFLLNNSELWVTDGTTAGTSQVKDFLGGSGSSNPENLTLASNDKVYFSATDGTHGRELWVTDGTEAGTNLVKDIATDSNSSSPQWLTPANNDKVFFSADDTGSNRELWITDGTTEGTALVKDIRVDGASEPKNLAFINNHLYFSADDGVNGRELWISDGTEAGTRMVTNLAPGATSSNPEQIVGYKGEVYFVANGSDGIELRKTNGTAEGTSLVRNIGPGGNSSSPQGLVVLTTSSGQSLLLFSANTAANGRELWKSNGTLDGTVMVRDIKPGGAASNPDQLTVVGNTLFFTADDGVNGVELWKSSGSEGGTSMVKNIAAGAASSSPKYLTEVGGKLFFVADDGVRGEELWVSNGTASGTVLVKDIVPGAGSPGIENLCNVDGVLCFSADDGVNGRELWVSDGTSAGTFILEDLTGDSSGSLPSHLIKYDGQLMFAATDYAYGNELRLAFVGPNIQVEHPAETPLTEPVDFGPVAYGSSAKQTITIRNNGRNILKSIKAQISGLNAAEFTLVKPLPKTSISPNTTTEVIVQFKPKEGGPRTATLTVFSNDGDEPAINITLNGSGEKDPYFTAQPVSRLVHAGDSVNFSGTVSSGSPLSYQWRKNGKKIAGATGTEFGIFSPTLSDAGAYTLLAQGSPLNAISNPAQLGVVVNEPTILAAGLGKKATLKVSAAGNNLSYRWKCGPDLNNLNPITDSALVTGSASKTLVLKALTLEDTAVYACEVTGPGGSLLGGTTVLSVFNAVPDVLPQSFEKGIVSGYYEHTILVDDDPTKAPLTYYTAKKLPSGLKLNSKTGVISGRPLKAGSFFVTLGAKNSFGKDEEKDIPLDIDPFPENIVGSYSGLVKRHDNLNGSLGGRIDLKITGTGVFSGSLVLGTTKYALKGALDVDVDKIAPPSIKLTIPRKGKPAPEPLTLNLTLSPDTSSFAGTVYTTDDTVDVEGWLQLPAADVPAYQGYHTFGMSPKTLDFAADEMPQGWSYGSFTVAKKTGKLKLAGKTADGEKITCSSVVGKDGQVLLFQTLYKPAGSLLGKLTLAKGTDEVNAADNTISGEVDWSRPASTSSKARVYKSGFGMPNLDLSTPLVLDVKGSFYPPTDAFFPGPKTAKLQFRLDQESLPETSPDITVDITSANKVVLPSSNPGAVSLKINAKTGVLSGSFTPVDDYTYKGKPHKRKTSFAGILIQNEGVNQGVGYFLLADPPTESLTPSTTPMQGGSVELLEQGLPPD
jgi:ELWxxDGT repeat protein